VGRRQGLGQRTTDWPPEPGRPINSFYPIPPRGLTHAHEVAQQKAIALLSDTSADAKAEAQAQVELASTRLDEASTSMKAAVETAPRPPPTPFTSKSIRLVGNLTTTASVTANASGGDIVKAIDTQITTARGVVAAQGDAVLSALTQVRTSLPATITASVRAAGQDDGHPGRALDEHRRVGERLGKRLGRQPRLPRPTWWARPPGR